MPEIWIRLTTEQSSFDIQMSSLHWSFSLSFCSFSYHLVQFKLAVNDVIVSQKGSNGDGKLYVLETKEQSVSDKKLLSVL